LVNVLVTGVSRYVGANLAARLASHPRVSGVVGFDTAAPSAELQELLSAHNVEIVTSDLRGVVSVVTGGDVDAVAHMGVLSAPGKGGRPAMKEHNIIGTMQLLAACQAATRLQKLVVRSSTAAYGASFRDPAVFTESTPPTLVPRGGFAKDVIEVEGYVRGFTRRRRDVTTTVLRLAPLVGPDADTTLTRYFALPLVPTVFGRGSPAAVHPRRRRAGAARPSGGGQPCGTYNVAGDGVILLSQAIRRAGRIGLPVVEPGMSAFAAFVKASGIGDFSLDQLDLLRARSGGGHEPSDRGVRLSPRSTTGRVRRLRATAAQLHRAGGFAASATRTGLGGEAMVLDGIRRFAPLLP
jgi:UDP-glucose 4-epimerase